jgi:hypothetical protein
LNAYTLLDGAWGLHTGAFLTVRAWLATDGALAQVASDAINTMPLVLFFPLIPFAFEILLVAYWMLVAATLYR